MKDNSEIKLGNKISGQAHTSWKRCFTLGKNSSIQTKHVFDVTDSITIGDNVLFAGLNTHVWTHHFQWANDMWQRYEVVSPVIIGNNNIINDRCTIGDGVTIIDNVILGANSCVVRDIEKSGLYVNAQMRLMPLDYESSLLNYIKVQSFIKDGNELFVLQRKIKLHLTN